MAGPAKGPPALRTAAAARQGCVYELGVGARGLVAFSGPITIGAGFVPPPRHTSPAAGTRAFASQAATISVPAAVLVPANSGARISEEMSA